MKDEELKEHNITGLRMMIASVLNSKPVDISMVSLISLYTIIVLILLGFGKKFYDDNKGFELTFQIIEIILLFIFCIDIAGRTYAFRMLFLKDKLTIIDI